MTIGASEPAKRATKLAVTLFLIVGLLVGTRTIYFTDKTSGSIKQMGIFCFIPYSFKLVYRCPGYNASKAHWNLSFDEAFSPPLSTGQSMAVRYGTNRFLISLSSVPNGSVATLNLHESGDLAPKPIPGAREMVLLGDSGLRWSFATRTSVYIYAGEYLTTASTDLPAVAYPISVTEAVEFMSGVRSNFNWRTAPREGALLVK